MIKLIFSFVAGIAITLLLIFGMSLFLAKPKEGRVICEYPLNIDSSSCACWFEGDQAATIDADSGRGCSTALLKSTDKLILPKCGQKLNEGENRL